MPRFFLPPGIAGPARIRTHHERTLSSVSYCRWLDHGRAANQANWLRLVDVIEVTGAPEEAIHENADRMAHLDALSEHWKATSAVELE